jgi:hypothetical protein
MKINQWILQSPGKFFKIKFFFSLPGEVFLVKRKKKSFCEKFAGRQQYKKLLMQFAHVTIILHVIQFHHNIENRIEEQRMRTR